MRPFHSPAVAAGAAWLALALAVPAAAQIRTVDPNAAAARPVETGGATPATTSSAAPPPRGAVAYPADTVAPSERDTAPEPAVPAETPDPAPVTGGTTPPPVPRGATYQEGDVLEAAENAFGEGAEDLAKLVQKILKDQGEPNAYIAGREAGGAFVAGVRYGSGTLSHKVEGQRPVFWTGPSIGFDVGGNGAKTFVLVYNLYDTQDLFRRYPAAEGAAYLVGGFTASYLRRGDVVLIPIRLGVGWRLGANIGYMRFSEKSKLLPF